MAENSRAETELERRRREERRPVEEAGGGESEGFELAEAELIEHASHGDEHSTRPIFRDAGLEEELTDAAVPYEVGISKHHELARGQILGETHGLLKLLVHPETRQLLGVHAFGSGATELVHVGQTVMALGGTVDYLVGAVFNYPTLAESYKVAALDATNKLRALSLTIGPRPAA